MSVEERFGDWLKDLQAAKKSKEEQPMTKAKEQDTPAEPKNDDHDIMAIYEYCCELRDMLNACDLEAMAGIPAQDEYLLDEGDIDTDTTDITQKGLYDEMF